jgi:hypothetical protein
MRIKQIQFIKQHEFSFLSDLKGEKEGFHHRGGSLGKTLFQIPHATWETSSSTRLFSVLMDR